MALQKPKSMDELAYFTRRQIGDKGRVVVWVFKEHCPRCKEGIPQKPTLRARTYDCDCGAQIPKQEYEDMLIANVEYTCPNCEHKGEKQVPFKRKKIKVFDEIKQKEVTADALIFECDSCGEKIKVTKKLK